jgi:hypothetical protein
MPRTEPGEAEGHDRLLTLLDSGKVFEPLMLAAMRDGRPMVCEGAHRSVAGADWLRRNPAKDLNVEVYYPCAQARALELP